MTTRRRDRLLAFLLLLTATVANAQESKEAADISESKSASVPVVPEEPTMISADMIDGLLVKKRSPQFKVLKDAVTQLQKEQYSKTLVTLRKYPAEGEFADYAHFLSGQAELGLARSLAKAGRKESAIAAAERAHKHFVPIVTNNVYSSLIKRSSVLLGESEIELGELMARGKQKAKAKLMLESGFQRLADRGLLILVPQKSIVTYALLCEKKPTELCEQWMGRLIGYIDKDEGAKLTKLITTFKPVTPVKPAKKATRQYNVALDLKEFQNGYAKYIAGDYHSAYETWYKILKEYPQTNIKLRTKFWMGRAAQRTQHELHAQTLFKEIIRDAPYAYYALLASWFGKIDLSRMIAAELPTASRLPTNSSPSDVIQLRRAEQFIANGLPELARMELRDLQIASATPNEFLVYLAYLNHKAQNHRSASSIYYELSNRGYTGLFSSFGQKILFPTTFLPQATKAAKVHNLDPLIPLSIMKQESAFDAEAVSFANAYGLMQLIRPTAKEMDPKITVPDLFVPEHNVRLGTKYIAQMLKRYKGSLVHALAAYNAGPHNSDRWQREISPSLPPEEYIELISYKETREYVQSIIRNIYWYNRIVNGETITGLNEIIQARSVP